MPAVPYDTLASVDLGSNSFHMLVANVTPAGGLSKLDSLRESVRLGQGLTKDRFLTREAQERALACLERFQQRLQSLPKGAVRVVGTNTLRKAVNASDFIHDAQEVLGRPIEIISGREEARLIYLGVLHGQDTRGGRRLVIDIGGGSTELILGEGSELTFVESLSLGCVSMSMAYFAGGHITRPGFDQAILIAKLAILPYCQRLLRSKWEHVIGCSGTIKSIRRIVRAEGWDDVGITLAALYRLRDKMVAAGHVDALDLPTLKESRRPVLAGGLAALIALFEMFGLERMEVSKQALREGLLYDLMGRFEQQDIRDETIRDMSKRWHIDEQQADRVTQMASYLFAQVKQDWELTEPHYEALLRWACSLHELGLQISHRRYHLHSAYVLSHADFSGFSFLEQRQLATLVLYHRKKFKVQDSLVDSEWLSQPIKYLCVVLRLAVLFCRERIDRPLPPVFLRASEGHLRLHAMSSWLDESPLIKADLDAERKKLAHADIELEIVPVTSLDGEAGEGG